MAGDWIKMRGNLWDDPRVSKLCELTDQPEAMVIGGLYWLWATADQHTEDGIMPNLSIRQIDRKTGIAGLGAALCEIGWIADHPDGIRIIGFEEHNGASAKRRSMDAQRKATVRNVSASQADKVETDNGQNAPVCGAREEKRREEKEEEIQKKASNPVLRPVCDGLDAEAWERWETYRRQIKKPIKPASLASAQRAMAAFGQDQAAAVEQSMANGWQGLFPIKAAPRAGNRADLIAGAAAAIFDGATHV